MGFGEREARESEEPAQYTHWNSSRNRNSSFPTLYQYQAMSNFATVGTLRGLVPLCPIAELNSPKGDPVYCYHLLASAGSLGPTSALCVHGGGLDTRLGGEKEQLGATSFSSTPADQDQQPTFYLLLCPEDRRVPEVSCSERVRARLLFIICASKKSSFLKIWKKERERERESHYRTLRKVKPKQDQW